VNNLIGVDQLGAPRDQPIAHRRLSTPDPSGEGDAKH
jgi:hypothetical protein